MRRSWVSLCFLALATASASWAQSSLDLRISPQRSELLRARTTDEITGNPAVESTKPPKPPSKLKVPKAGFLLLSGLTYSAAGMDMHDTTDSINLCRKYYCVGDAEGDPIARPFTHMPTPAYYAAGYALATGVNWLGWKMGRSPRWHKVWWLPQVISISLNTEGIYSHHS